MNEVQVRIYKYLTRSCVAEVLERQRLGQDPYKAIAAFALGKNIENVTSEERNIVKTYCFAQTYGGAIPNHDESANDVLVRAQAATPGPYTIQKDHNDQLNLYADNGNKWIALLPHQCVKSIEREQAKNAEFLAHAREDVLNLILRLETERKAIEALRTGLQVVLDVDSLTNDADLLSKAATVVEERDALRNRLQDPEAHVSELEEEG